MAWPTEHFSDAASYGSNDHNSFGSRVLQLASGEILQHFGVRRMDGEAVAHVLHYQP